MEEPFGNSRRKLKSFLFLTFLLFLLYISNLRVIASSDTIPNRILPVNIVIKKSLYLDSWGPAYLHGGGSMGPYFFAESRGHLVSAYPIIMPVMLSPLYIGPCWWLQNEPRSLRPLATDLVVDTMEKLSAALIAALSVGLLFLALLKVASFECSLLVSAICGVASETWAVSSQGLWRQGFAELAFAFLLWALVRSPQARWYGFLVGLAIALATANNQLYGIVALVFLVCFALRQRHQLEMFILPIAVLVGLSLAYNYYFVGNLLGHRFTNLAAKGPWANTHDLSHPLWQGVLGQLISPSRGLLIYMPWTLFSLWGGLRLWRASTSFWHRYLLVSTLGVYFIRAKFSGWWGGWCYGPRYLTDVLPILAFLLVPIWPVLRSSRLMRIAMGTAVAVAVGIQVLGAFQYSIGVWDSTPNNIDDHQERLWDWKNTQIVSCWKGGMRGSELDKRWGYYFGVKGELARRGLIPARGSSPAPR